MMLADAVVTVTFKPTAEGGRTGPTPADWFGCILTIEGQNFDVRLDLRGVGAVNPGQTVKVPMKFLDSVSAANCCVIGAKFLLRESRQIAGGTIDELFVAPSDLRVSNME